MIDKNKIFDLTICSCDKFVNIDKLAVGKIALVVVILDLDRDPKNYFSH